MGKPASQVNYESKGRLGGTLNPIDHQETRHHDRADEKKLRNKQDSLHKSFDTQAIRV